MTFGILDWIAVVVFLAAVLICTIRGFVRSVAGIVKIVGAFLLAKILGPLLGKLISLYVIGPKVYEWLEARVSEMVGGAADTLNLSALFREESGEFAALLNRFGASGEMDALEKTYGDTVEATTETLSEMVRSFASPWVDRLSVAIGCVLVFIAAFLLLMLVTKLIIFIVERIDVLNGMNHFFGFLLGLVGGAFAIVAVCYCLNLLTGALAFVGSSSDAILEELGASVLFGHIYRFVMGIR